MNMPLKKPQKPSQSPNLMLLLSALLFACMAVFPSFAAALTEECTDCHGTFGEVHGEVDHTTTPPSSQVVIFQDYGHDDAGWVEPKPHFAVQVDCITCHTNDLIAIHGSSCLTCHPTPYDTLGIWNGGCQQGGCHSTSHGDSIIAHTPFEDPYDSQNDCNRCHDSTFAVPQSKCLTCHASYGGGDVSPPSTTSDAKSSYNGPAKIVFSITDNGKVGIGTTFYILDGGKERTGAHVLVTNPGQHDLEFWSVDQAGNVESPSHRITFTTLEDTTAPMTTSDARESYEQGATINLTATDDSDLGVKTTYYRLNDGPVQTGTVVQIPPENGTISYTLTFWSEDWSGNIEVEKSVQFTVTSGSGTLRLIWESSDVNGSPCPDDPGAAASWKVHVDSLSGPIVASGSGACPNWDGVDDVTVRISSSPYYINIEWSSSIWGYDVSTFSDIYITEPGQLKKINY